MIKSDPNLKRLADLGHDTLPFESIDDMKIFLWSLCYQQVMFVLFLTPRVWQKRWVRLIGKTKIVIKIQTRFITIK